MSKIVLPIHANGSFNTFGGQLLHWMETCAALCGGKFADNFLLTAK
jgi:acyl-CoA hydrolase